MFKRRYGCAAALAVGCSMALASVASASSVTYDFSHNIGGNTSLTGSEFVMTVNDLGNNTASFVFQNNGPAGSAITGIWFYGSAVDGDTGVIDNSTTTGTFVEDMGKPANLPGGNGYGLTNDTKEFYSKAKGNNGIRAGEYLTITMGLQGSFQDLIAALDSGLGISQANPFTSNQLVVGLQVQGLPNGQSDQFLTGTPINEDPPVVIPLPAPVWMGLAGLLGVAVVRRRRSSV